MSQCVPGVLDRRSVAILSTGHCCIDLCQGAVPAMLPFFVTQRHLSYAAAGGLVLATTLASSIIQPIFGRFSDRFPAPWLMPAGLLIAATGVGLAGLAPNYWLIALSLALSGVGVAAFHPEAARTTNLTAGKNKATAMSLFSVGGSLGFALGPVCTTALLLGLGLNGTGVLLVPVALIALVFVAAFPRFAFLQRMSMQGERRSSLAQRNAWGAFSLLSGAVICRSIVFYGLNTFLPLYWVMVLGSSKTAGSLALVTVLLAGVVGTLLGGRMADRYGRRTMVLILLAMQAPAMLLFVTLGTSQMPLAFALLVLIGLSLSAPSSIMIVMGQEYVPGAIGTASGVTLGLAVSVGGIAAPVFGHVADLYGMHSALLGLACVPLVAVACILALPRPRRSPEKPFT